MPMYRICKDSTVAGHDSSQVALDDDATKTILPAEIGYAISHHP
jgi:hypothetical protein